MNRAIILALTAVLAAPALAPLGASWGNDAIQEPSSPKHDLPKYMWQFPNDRDHLVAGKAPDRIYFNTQLSNAFALRGLNAPDGRLEPVLVKADALLGYWRDCNNDGYIGNMYLGMKDYTVSEAALTPNPVDIAVCPQGSEYHNTTGWPGAWRQLGPVIHEFIDIGPARNYYHRWVTWQVNDPDARVWGDLGLPEEPRRVAASFRDPLAESPTVLFFPRGTFDSWNGHLRWLDTLTFGDLGRTWADVPLVGGDLYSTPLASMDTPLRVVRYDVYSNGNEQNGWEGRPLVRAWDCSSGAEDPALGPSVDPDGSVMDSVNHSFMGARQTLVVPHPQGGTLASAALNVGPGCDGADGQQTFNDGLVLPHPEDPTIASSDEKIQVDMFFQYRPPHDQPSDMATAMWGLVPRLDRTFSATWYGHQVFFHDGPVDRDADYFTFYAKVGTASYTADSIPDPGPHALPGAKVVSGRIVPPVYTYGAEACESGTPDTLGWDCSAWPQPSAAWDAHYNHEWGVKLAETYQLRDVDCVDLTPAAPEVMGIAKENANAVWNYGITAVSPDVAAAVGDQLFTATCE